MRPPSATLPKVSRASLRRSSLKLARPPRIRSGRKGRGSTFSSAARPIQRTQTLEQRPQLPRSGRRERRLETSQRAECSVIISTSSAKTTVRCDCALIKLSGHVKSKISAFILRMINIDRSDIVPELRSLCSDMLPVRKSTVLGAKPHLPPSLSPPQPAGCRYLAPVKQRNSP